MVGAHCESCNAPVASGTHCAACAGNASTVIAATPARKPGDPLIGVEVIGQYVIRSQLGKGGMGAVYLADQPSVGRRAVIKVLHPRLSNDADTRRRFETEARAASQLNHPNIVTIYNYGAMDDDTLFLAMEHLDGVTLAQAIAKKRMPLPRAVSIVCRMAEALGEAHRHGVVHRDVKPTNVMLVARGDDHDFVKVLDFGIAHVDGTRVTATGDICGTPTYMSPEQVRGQGVDGRSDLYSLGCILFELVTGDVPFKGGNALNLAYQHANDPPPTASDVAPKANISPSLDAFLARALAKNPADRPRDAANFRDELHAALVPVSKAESPKPAAKPESKALPRPVAKPSTPGVFRRAFDRLRGARRRKSLLERVATRMKTLAPRARRRRSRWPWIVAASVIALSLIGIGWYLTRDDTRPRPPAPTKTKPTKRSR